MKPMRSPARPCPHRTIGPGAASVRRAAFAVAAMGILSACEQNTFVPPPAAKVDVAVPLQRSFTRYLEATGNTAAILVLTWACSRLACALSRVEVEVSSVAWETACRWTNSCWRL